MRVAEDPANHKVDFSGPYPSNAALCILMNLSPFPYFIGNVLLLGKFRISSLLHLPALDEISQLLVLGGEEHSLHIVVPS